jgi:putative flavoprotein involved in K+ transport
LIDFLFGDLETAPSSKSVIDLGDYKQQLKSKNPDQQQMFTSFYSDGVIWPDGRKEQVEAVILATGYKNNFPHLGGTGAINSKGEPLYIAGVSTTVQGLYFVGIEGQRSIASATLRGVGSDAKYVIKKLVGYLTSI